MPVIAAILAAMIREIAAMTFEHDHPLGVAPPAAQGERERGQQEVIDPGAKRAMRVMQQRPGALGR